MKKFLILFLLIPNICFAQFGSGPFGNNVVAQTAAQSPWTVNINAAGYSLSGASTISTATRINVNTFAGIQTAINTLQTAGTGGIVHIACGAYSVTSAITGDGLATHPIIIEGEGKCTGLNPQTGINTFVIGDNTNAAHSGWQIRDLQIWGSATDQGGGFNSGVGITLNNMTGTRITNVNIQGGVGGLLVQTNAGSTTTYDYSEYDVFDNVNITQNDNYGVEYYIPGGATNAFINDVVFTNGHIGGNAVQIILNNSYLAGQMDSNPFIGTYIESNTAVYPNTNNLITSTAATNISFTGGNINRGANSGTQNSINMDSNSIGWIFGEPVATHIIAAGGQNSYAIAGGAAADNSSFPTLSARRLAIGGNGNASYADFYGGVCIGGGCAGTNAAPSNGLLVIGNVELAKNLVQSSTSETLTAANLVANSIFQEQGSANSTYTFDTGANITAAVPANVQYGYTFQTQITNSSSTANLTVVGGSGTTLANAITIAPLQSRILTLFYNGSSTWYVL